MVLPLIGSLISRFAAPLAIGAAGAALGGAVEHFAGDHRGRRRTVKGRVVLDEHGNVIAVIRERRKKPKRLPKYAQEALKAQAELTKKMSDYLQMLIIKEAIAEANK